MRRLPGDTVPVSRLWQVRQVRPLPPNVSLSKSLWPSGNSFGSVRADGAWRVGMAAAARSPCPRMASCLPRLCHHPFTGDRTRRTVLRSRQRDERDGSEADNADHDEIQSVHGNLHSTKAAGVVS